MWSVYSETALCILITLLQKSAWFNNYRVTIMVSLVAWASLVALSVKDPPEMQETACIAGGAGLVLSVRRCFGDGNGTPLQYSCLGNTMDREHWQTTVHGIKRVSHGWVTKTPSQKYSSSECILYSSASLIYGLSEYEATVPGLFLSVP